MELPSSWVCSHASKIDFFHFDICVQHARAKNLIICIVVVFKSWNPNTLENLIFSRTAKQACEILSIPHALLHSGCNHPPEGGETLFRPWGACPPGQLSGGHMPMVCGATVDFWIYIFGFFVFFTVGSFQHTLTHLHPFSNQQTRNILEFKGKLQPGKKQFRGSSEGCGLETVMRAR